MRLKKKGSAFFLFFVALAIASFFVCFNENFFLVMGGSLEESFSGRVVLNILGNEDLFVNSPKEIVYSFNKSADDYYFPVSDFLIDLNVSASFDVVGWSYFLTQKTPSGKMNTFQSGNYSSGWSSKLFDMFPAYRWENEMIVFAHGEDGGVRVSNPIPFFVFVENSHPLIEDNFDEEYFICEGKSLDSVLFHVVDRDEDDLDISISSANPIYLGRGERISGSTILSRLISTKISKEDIGEGNPVFKEHPVTIYADDGSGVDSKDLLFTFLEINNLPIFKQIGAQTIWVKGDDSVFSEIFSVIDIEDGESSEGNLDFTISFSGLEDLFDISEYGEMFFSPGEDFLGEEISSNYIVTVCATDRGIENTHESLFEHCREDGSSKTVCDSFSLTVTSENRPPILKNYFPFPSNEVLNFVGGEEIYFNASGYDPDGGTLDFYWYVDEGLEKYSSSVLSDSFNHSFGCGISGIRRVGVVVSDGLLNDSLEWRVNLTELSCGVSSGGGGGGAMCVSEWACEDWGVCQNVEKSLAEGFLVGRDYRTLKEECSKEGLDEIYCGFQTRDCLDLNSCKDYSKVPLQIRTCYFSEDPSCFDKIKNCHDGGCEIGVDCGGPCGPCPTCSDGILNQGEQGIDCGGPCPWPCPVEYPNRFGVLWIFVGAGILLILLVLILIRLWKIYSYKKCISSKQKGEGCDGNKKN